MLTFVEGEIRLKCLPVEVGEWLWRQPECKMWAVCLAQAIAGAVGLVRCNDLRRYTSRDRYWLFRDKRHQVGSCSWICELLGVDRQRLIKYVWTNRHAIKKSPYRLRSLG